MDEFQTHPQGFSEIIWKNVFCFNVSSAADPGFIRGATFPRRHWNPLGEARVLDWGNKVQTALLTL